MKTNDVTSTCVTDLNLKEYPIELENGGKIILETIHLGNGQKKFKETVVIPHQNPPKLLSDRGLVMAEVITDENGKTHHKPVLLIERNQRPGVWHNGVERPRKQMIYDLISGITHVHPRDDVRNRR